jgi:hypothetical protein
MHALLSMHNKYIMCKKLKCISIETSTAGWVCNCNAQCYACSHPSTSDCYLRGELKSFDFRNKYVCLPCRRIWKSAVCKYEYADNWDIREPKLSKQKSSRSKGLTKYDDLLRVYTNKTANCAKCSNPGILVGRNFRHCKTEKLWKRLIADVATNKINLVDDFYDYPKSNF